MRQVWIRSGWSSPATTEGVWSIGLALGAVTLGLLGEAARGRVGGPFYALAFGAAIAAAVAAVVSYHRGERSALVGLVALLPALVGVAFLVAGALGGA